MHTNANRPVGGSTGAALDCNSQRDCSQHTPNQGNNKAPIVGRKFGHWTAVWTDATAKRIHCQCICGRVRVLGLDQLEAGAISSCGCRPPTIQEREAFRDERARRKAVSR